MRKRSSPRYLLIFICCLLAVPTVGELMGFYPVNWTLQDMKPALLTGALLGIAHLILRPILRLISAPLGCLTLGLIGMAIDVGLIYLSAAFVDGFQVPSTLYALITAMLINLVCALAAGRR